MIQICIYKNEGDECVTFHLNVNIIFDKCNNYNIYG